MKKLGAWLLAFGAACVLAAACHVYVDEPPTYSSPPPPQRQYQYAYAAPPPQPAPPPAQPAPPPPPRPAPPAPPAPRPRPPPPPPESDPSEYEAEPDYPYNSPNPPPHRRHRHPQPDASAPTPAPSLALASAPTPAPASTPAQAPAPAQAPPALCLDTAPSPIADCSTVKPPSGCTPALSPAKKCATFKAYFDPKVAASAVSCMLGLSAKQVCDPSQITACSKGALAQACTDPSVTQVCQIAVTNCKASAADCTVLLSGLNDDGQEKVAQCVAKGCPGGLFACVDALK